MSIKVVQCMFGKGLGGLEQVFLDHTQALVNDFETYAFCHSQSPLTARLDEIVKGRWKGFTGTVNCNPAFLFRVAAEIRKISPDIIFMHGNRAISILTNPLVRRFIPAKTRLCATTHNKRNKRFVKLNACIAITGALTDDLKQRGICGERIFYCPNAVDLAPETEYKPKQPPVIGVLGRFHPVKGFDIFLEACSILDKREVKFKAVLGGDGEEMKSLREGAAGISQEVSFPGWISDTASFFESIDVFCLSSRSEGLPVAMLGAMAHSKPCVITALDGPMEVAAKFDAAVVVERENPEALADGLEKLLKNETLAAELAEKARFTIEKEYSTERQRERLADICEKIMELKAC